MYSHSGNRVTCSSWAFLVLTLDSHTWEEGGEGITTSSPGKIQVEYAFMEHFPGVSYSVRQVGVIKRTPTLETQSLISLLLAV